MTLTEDLVAWLADLADYTERRRIGEVDAGEHDALMARKHDILERIRQTEQHNGTTA